MVTAVELLAFGFTDDLVDRIMKFLNESASDLAVAKPDDVVHAAFGSAPASLACSTDAGKARQHVVDAITDMVEGLHGYHSSLDGMKKNAHELDFVHQTDIRQLLVRAEDCLAAPTMSSLSQCTPSAEPFPTSSSEVDQ